MRRIMVAPSVLSADFSRLGAEIKSVEEAGADVIHLDVMDGAFVPNITFGFPVIKSVRKVTSLPFDTHLMIENPDRYLEDFKNAGCDWLTVQAEACIHLQRTLSVIRKLGMKAGVALNPHTPPDVLEYIMDDLDLVLIMTVNPGFGGQKFLRTMLAKIRKVRNMIDESGNNILIQVDGGITPETAPEVIAAGAEVLVAGSAVFQSDDYKKTIDKLKTGD
ncbi:MAG: ribulose-phosphate 3-epimerase [Firmicutes bacterium]|nr:ribulose-phosphate 3-epimerase [Bacillota bacterium]